MCMSCNSSGNKPFQPPKQPNYHHRQPTQQQQVRQSGQTPRYATFGKPAIKFGRKN